MNSRMAMALLILALLIAPMIYVLSAAPVIWLSIYGYLPGWVADIYHPAYAVPILKKFIQWQLDMLPY